MTPEQIAAAVADLERLDAEAAPAPWSFHRYTRQGADPTCPGIVIDSQGKTICTVWNLLVGGSHQHGPGVLEANADITISLRNTALPIIRQLRAELESAHAERDGLRKAISKIDCIFGEPNEVECSPYDVDLCDERVIEQVRKLKTERDAAVKELALTHRDFRMARRDNSEQVDELSDLQSKLIRAEATLTKIAQGGPRKKVEAAREAKRYFAGRTPQIIAVLDHCQKECESLRADLAAARIHSEGQHADLMLTIKQLRQAETDRDALAARVGELEPIVYNLRECCPHDGIARGKCARCGMSEESIRKTSEEARQ